MVAHGIKSVVKLEDIPVADAAQFAVARPGWSVTLSSTYRKDYLLLRSRPCPATDREAMVSIYCSRGDMGRELSQLETASREDSQRAATLLEIPQCCAAAFAADFDTARRDQDTVNDDACRRVLATTSPSLPGAWQCNPLADTELLGFYPCSCQCPSALQRAEQVLSRLDTAQQQHARQTLRRPALYFRLPFFATMQGTWQDDVLRFTDFGINAFGHPLARTAQALLAAHLQPWLDGSDGMVVRDGALRLYRGMREIKALDIVGDHAPVVTCWTDDSEKKP